MAQTKERKLTYMRSYMQDYRQKTPEDWDKALVKKHVYKSSTLQTVKKVYDNAHKYLTDDEKKEYN